MGCMWKESGQMVIKRSNLICLRMTRVMARLNSLWKINGSLWNLKKELSSKVIKWSFKIKFKPISDSKNSDTNISHKFVYFKWKSTRKWRDGKYFLPFTNNSKKLLKLSNYNIKHIFYRFFKSLNNFYQPCAISTSTKEFIVILKRVI